MEEKVLSPASIPSILAGPLETFQGDA